MVIIKKEIIENCEACEYAKDIGREYTLHCRLFNKIVNVKDCCSAVILNGEMMYYDTTKSSRSHCPECGTESEKKGFCKHCRIDKE